MRIKFIKDYAINRGACPLNIGGFDMLETKIVKAGTVVDLEKDNEDDAFNDELVEWLVENAFAVWLEMTTDSEAFCLSVESCVSIVDDGFVPATNVKFPNDRQEQRNKFTDYLGAVRVVSEDEGFMNGGECDWGYPIYKGGALHVEDFPLFVEDSPVRAYANTLYFDTREHAIASLQNHTKEWETICAYKWGKE